METRTGKPVVIYLMRNDLRVHDNECLYWAHQNGDYVIPLFCFDKNILGHTALTWHYKFAKTATPVSYTHLTLPTIYSV